MGVAVAGNCEDAAPVPTPCSLEAGVDFLGHDVANAATDNIQECVAGCLELDDCVVFTFAYGSCWFKSSDDGRSANTNAVSGTCGNPTQPWLQNASGSTDNDLEGKPEAAGMASMDRCTLTPDTDYLGHDLWTEFAVDVTECINKCTLDSACTHFTFLGSSCYYKSSGAGIQSRLGAVAGSCKHSGNPSPCMLEYGIDLHGFDLANQPTTDVAECISACASLDGCMYFTFVWGKCWFKTSDAGRTASKFAISGTCTADGSPAVANVNVSASGVVFSSVPIVIPISGNLFDTINDTDVDAWKETTCTLELGYDLFGNNLKNGVRQAENASVCIDLCVPEPQCTHFTYLQRMCYLKDSDAGRQAKPDAVSGSCIKDAYAIEVLLNSTNATTVLPTVTTSTSTSQEPATSMSTTTTTTTTGTVSTDGLVLGADGTVVSTQQQQGSTVSPLDADTEGTPVVVGAPGGKGGIASTGWTTDTAGSGADVGEGSGLTLPTDKDPGYTSTSRSCFKPACLGCVRARARRRGEGGSWYGKAAMCVPPKCTFRVNTTPTLT